MQSNSVKKRDLLVQGCNVTLQFAPGNPPRAGIEQEQMEMAEKSTRQLHSYVSSVIAVSCPLALGQCSEQDRGHRELQQQRRAAACPLQGECLWAGTSPCSLRHILRALKGWDQAEVQFCVTEHEGTHASFLPLHPCFGAFMPQTKCLLRCFSLQLLS